MRGDEQRVVDAFVRWLTDQGWNVQTEVNFVDVYAERDGAKLYAEAKGHTANIGGDVDTMYGQLLRRMLDEAAADTRYAVVVPSRAVTAMLRVPAWVRRRLVVDVYEVTDSGDVRLAADAAPPDAR